MGWDNDIKQRRTFAIISHPDAGKTTITEKVLLHGAMIQKAGTVKGRKTGQYARSDWMEMEKERGISVTTSVMQFPYQGCMVNLLDTPGHEDFSEDTYRTLTAVDSCLMVIDGAKGVEARTIKLMEVARLRDTPIITFMNKLDREIRDPVELLDEVESVLGIACAPITWPIGMGRDLRGVYHLLRDEIYCYQSGQGHTLSEPKIIQGLASPAAEAALGDWAGALREQLDLVQGVLAPFDLQGFLAGEITPVFWGTALGNFGIDHMLEGLTQWAPPPQPRASSLREVLAEEAEFSGFVFKIQANMDPQHRDRIAFLRIVSGQYEPGMKLHHVRLGKSVRIADALTFQAGDRARLEHAVAGDIIGIHNHGTIQIGDTFSTGESLQFKGIPNFAPELFRRIQLRDPLKMKQLQKGLQQLAEEGAVQVFRPLRNNELIVGAVGPLQFDVVVHRLRSEYKVDAIYESVAVATARWVIAEPNVMAAIEQKSYDFLARDSADALTYLAPSHVNLQLAIERHPDVRFMPTREHAG